MKNKKLLIKISIIIVSVLILSIIIFSFLGKKERIGYLSDFKINIDKTLELNNFTNIEKTKELFTLNNELNYDAISNYIFTNSSITNYNYSFRIKYYSKVFRNSDIYGVYPNLNDLPEYIKSVEMDNKFGTPFGSLISTKELNYNEKIDNINYVLKLKYNNILIIILVVIIAIFIFFDCIDKVYNILKNINIIITKNKIFILRICFIITIVLIVSIISLAFLGKKERIGYLSDFKINIDKTLELNNFTNIEKTKELFTLNNKLNYDAISNYIFTNSSITNYNYSFRIKYYSKVFRNSDIYDVYPNLENLPNYIKSVEMGDRFGTPFGSLISTEELKYDDKIDTKYYLMIKFDIFYYIGIIFIIVLLCVVFYLLKEYWIYKKTLDKKDIIFINMVELLYFILIIFKIWLFYPGGYLSPDTIHTISGLGLNISYDHNPVIIDLVIKFISKLGFTLGEVFVVNTIIFYLSFCLITISLYIRYRNKKLFFLFLILFIHPLFFNSIIYLKGFIAIIYVIFSYSLVFTAILIPIKQNNKNILKCLSLIFLIIGMLHRHNFIVTVYPILIWFVYDYLKNKNIKILKKYLFSFASIMFINAIILMGIHYIFPRIFCQKIVHEQIASVLYIQTVETMINANDYSFIPSDMYKENKSFADIKNYKDSNKNNLYYYYASLWDQTYVNINTDIKKQKDILLKLILKHPISYIKFLFNFAMNIYTVSYQNDIEVNYVDKIDHNVIYDYVLELYPGAEKSSFYIKFRNENRGFQFTELKLNILSYFKRVLPVPNILIFVLLSFILFIIDGLLLLFKNNLTRDMLVLSFSLAFSSSATAIIIVIFGNFNGYRLIYPTMPIGIMSLIAFVSFIYDCGGFKSFFKKLNTN